MICRTRPPPPSRSAHRSPSSSHSDKNGGDCCAAALHARVGGWQRVFVGLKEDAGAPRGKGEKPRVAPPPAKRVRNQSIAATKLLPATVARRPRPARVAVCEMKEVPSPRTSRSVYSPKIFF
jgi:hypothetical protein